MDDETVVVIGEDDGDVVNNVAGVEGSDKESNEGTKKSAELKYTDEDINKIVDAKFAKWQEKKEKELSEAKKLAEMSAQEKLEFERDQLKAELERLRESKDRNDMLGVARTMLAEHKLTIDENLLDLLVVKDADKTKGNVDSFIKLFNEAVNKGVLDRVKNPNEKRGSVSKMSREEIYAIKDPILRQKKIEENYELFK